MSVHKMIYQKTTFHITNEALKDINDKSFDLKIYGSICYYFSFLWFWERINLLISKIGLLSFWCKDSSKYRKKNDKSKYG